MSEQTDDRYSAYLNSEQWHTLRDAVMCRACYRCEVGDCGRPAIEIHHLTYERLYREELTDLVAICGDCHESLTDPSARLKLRCLEDSREGCSCPVCEYRRSSEWVVGKMRDRLAGRVNCTLHETNLRLYGQAKAAVQCYAGVARRLLPPALFCHRTGLAAGAEGACGTCDCCAWVELLEISFREEEDEPTDEQVQTTCLGESP